SSCCSGQGSWTSGKSASGEPGSTSSGRLSAAAASGGTPRSAQASGLATASSGISSSSVGRVSLSCAAIGQAISEADAANATMRRRKLGELVLLLSARRPVLAAAFDADGLFAPGGGDGADEGTLLVGGEASPAGRSEPLERAIADLVLHPRRSIDPIAEIDVGKAGLGRPADMIENNVVPKPGPHLMFRVVEAVDHRQPVPLPVGQAGADQAALPPVRRGFPIFDDKAGNGRVFHHVRVIYLVHGGHAAPRMAAAEIALKQLELLTGGPRTTFGGDQIAIPTQISPLTAR